MTVPCGACDRPAEQHPAYAAVVGVHDWTPPRQMHGPVDSDRRTSPRAVPHPDGGVTMQWIEDHDPDPVPGGGDRLPTRASGA